MKGNNSVLPLHNPLTFRMRNVWLIHGISFQSVKAWLVCTHHSQTQRGYIAFTCWKQVPNNILPRFGESQGSQTRFIKQMNRNRQGSRPVLRIEFVQLWFYLKRVVFFAVSIPQIQMKGQIWMCLDESGTLVVDSTVREAANQRWSCVVTHHFSSLNFIGHFHVCVTSACVEILWLLL